jgi:precorrin-6B methylase 2
LAAYVKVMLISLFARLVCALALLGVSQTVTAKAIDNLGAPTTITLSATASDPDGTVSRVEFYQGATLIGTAANAPYTVNWTTLASGPFTLTAKAIDNLGASGDSAPVGITINGAVTFLHDRLASEREVIAGASDPSAHTVRLAQSGAPARKPDVLYVPTPEDVVAAMLKLAKVTRKDVVYDLGSGDGRIVIMAATRYGARGVGIDIDAERVREAAARVRAANLDGRVKIVHGDLFEIDIREATVVTLYLSEKLNRKLRPRFLAELKPGTRIVSHHFDMGDWKPDETVKVGDTTIYLWRIPERKE